MAKTIVQKPCIKRCGHVCETVVEGGEEHKAESRVCVFCKYPGVLQRYFSRPWNPRRRPF